MMACLKMREDAETQLLVQYWRWIMGVCRKYAASTSIPLNSPLYEDMISEACIAFVQYCRENVLPESQFAPRDYFLCRLKMKSAMRVYIWRDKGMKGSNNRRIECRCETFSDMLRDGETMENLIPGYVQDETRVDVRQFIKTLPENEQKVVVMAMMGYSMNTIAKALSVSRKTPYNILSRISRRESFVQSFSENTA